MSEPPGLVVPIIDPNELAVQDSVAISTLLLKNLQIPNFLQLEPEAQAAYIKTANEFMETSQDKGHCDKIRSFLDALRYYGPSEIKDLLVKSCTHF